MSDTTGRSNAVRWSFFVTTAVVIAAYVIHDLAGQTFLPRKSLIGGWGFIGLITINIVLFSVTLLQTMWVSRKIDTQNISEEEQERLAEETMTPALQGKAPPPEGLARLMEIPLGASAGLLAGAVLAWFILLVLRWVGVIVAPV